MIRAMRFSGSGVAGAPLSGWEWEMARSNILEDIMRGSPMVSDCTNRV